MKAERTDKRIAMMRKMIDDMLDATLRIRERVAKMEGVLDDIELGNNGGVK